MAGNNRYVFEVVSDWSQPERAVRQYAESARQALKSIQTEGRKPKGAARSDEQIKSTRQGYISQAEGLGRQKGILTAELGAAKANTQRAIQLENALKKVEKDIKLAQESAARFAKAVGDTTLSANTSTAIKAGYAQIERALKDIAAAKKKEATDARKAQRDAEKTANDSKREKDRQAKAEKAKTDADLKAAAAAKKAADRAAKKAAEPMEKERAREERARRRADPTDPLGQARAKADAAERALLERRRAEREKANERAARNTQRDEFRRHGIADPGNNAAAIAIAQRRLAHAIQIQALENERAAIGSRETADTQYRIWRLKRENEKAANRALIEQIQAADRARPLTGPDARAGWFQQFVAARRNAQGIPTAEDDAPTARQAIMGGLGNRLKSSLQFAASGALIYGGQKFIRETITEASELQSQLSLLQGQFEASGESGNVSFQEIKDSIIETSTATGIMATQVAEIERRLMGVFRTQNAAGEDTGPDFGAVAESTRVSAQLSQITGLDTKTITDELVAVYKSFEGSVNEINFAALSDHLVTVAQSAGVTEKELLEMTSSLAPLANQLGFTSQQLLGFSAAAISSSGKGASVLAENFGRVLTDLSSKQADIMSFYSQVPSLAGKIPALQDSFARGDIQEVLTSFVGDWDQMTTQMKNSFAEKVFGRREAQSIVSILNQGTRTVELSEMEEDPQATETRLQRRQETVQYALDTMERKFEEFGDALYAAGIGDAIKVLLAALSGFAEVGTSIANVLGKINEAMEGLPGYLLAAAAAWKVYAVAVARANASQMFGGRGNLVLPGAGLFGRQAIATGGRLNPYVAGATPFGPGVAAASGSSRYTSGVNAALGSRMLGRPTAGLLRMSGQSGIRGGIGALGATGMGGIASVAPAVAVMGALVAVGVMQSRREKWIEEVNLIAQQEEQQIRALSEQGKTPEEIRAELGDADSKLPNQGFWDRGYGKVSTGFSATVRSVGAVAMAPLDVFGEGLSGFQDRASDIRRDTAERNMNPIERERQRVEAEVLRDERRNILALFDGKSKREKERREEILKNLSGDASEEMLRDLIQQYLKDPTNENIAAQVEQIIGAANMNEIVGPLVQAETAQTEARKAFEDAIAGTQSDEALATLDTLRRSVETGGAGRTALLSALNERLQIYRDQLAAVEKAKGNEDQIREATALVTEAENEYTKVLLERFDTPAFDAASELRAGGDPAEAVRRTQARLAELQGLTGPSEAETSARQAVTDLTANARPNLDAVAAAQGRVRDAQAAGENGLVLEDAVQAQFEAAEAHVEAKQAELQALINATEDVQEKERLRQQGITLEDNVRGAYIDQQLLQGTNPENVAILAENLGKETEEIWDMIKAALVQGDATIEAGMELALMDAENQLNGLLQMSEAAGARLSRGDRESLDAAIAAQRAAVDVARANLEAFRGIQANVVDPGATVTGGDNAAAVAADEQKARDDAREEARQGIERRKIAARNDPVAVAKLQLESAELDLQIARAINDKSQIAQALTGVAQAKAAVEDALRESAKTRISGQAAIMSARAGGDPLAAAQASAWEANALAGLAQGDEVAGAVAAQIESAQRVQEAMQDIQRAQLEYAQAAAFGDPVRQAQLGLQMANYNVATAQGEAERLRALIAQMDAQRALQQAIVDVFNAWNDIAVAQREAAGDTIGAAKLELDRIKKNLDSARQQGDNMKVLELTAQQIRAEAALRDATLQDRQSDIDFALQMQQITTGQAIAQLELLLQIPNLTKQQIQDLQLKIKQLKDDLGRDYQFNLPSELGLPTLYEVRRMNQSGGDYQQSRNGAPAAQVQDNRSYQIAIDAKGVDAKEALRVVTDAIQAPVTTGARGLGY